MNAMRTAVTTLAFLSPIAAGLPPAVAEIYRPWCVSYPATTTKSCAFSSFEQCMMTAGPGTGGVCVQNPWYLQYGERAPSFDAKYRRERGSGR
jgi:uncharacterized protein DUF3551